MTIPFSPGFTRRAVAPLACVLLSLAACSGSSDTGGGGGTSAQSTSSTGGDSVCADDPRAQTYAVGLEQASDDGAVKIRFMDANPAPPAKGNNKLVIELVDGSDQPIQGATITLKPFMPDHGHGSSVTPEIAPMEAAGEYSVDLLTLFMPGIWQLTFTVTPEGGAASTVVFTFCVDG